MDCSLLCKERTSFANAELEISPKQIFLVFGSSTSRERARTRAKRRVSDQSDIAPWKLISLQCGTSCGTHRGLFETKERRLKDDGRVLWVWVSANTAFVYVKLLRRELRKTS
jgi:hypothetical protein